MIIDYINSLRNKRAEEFKNEKKSTDSTDSRGRSKGGCSKCGKNKRKADIQSAKDKADENIANAKEDSIFEISTTKKKRVTI